MASAHDLRPGSPFRELDVVTIRATIGVGGRIIPSGSRGTIVHAYRDGLAFEIEFTEPVPTVVKIDAVDIDALQWRG